MKVEFEVKHIFMTFQFRAHTSGRNSNLDR